MLFKLVNNTIIKAADGKTRRFCSAKTKQFYGGMEKFSNAGDLITTRLTKTTMNYYSKNIIKKGTQRKNQEKKQRDLSLHTVPCIKF